MSCGCFVLAPNRFSSSRVIATSPGSLSFCAGDWSVHRRGGSVAIERCVDDDAMPAGRRTRRLFTRDYAFCCISSSSNPSCGAKGNNECPADTLFLLFSLPLSPSPLLKTHADSTEKKILKKRERTKPGMVASSWSRWKGGEHVYWQQNLRLPVHQYTSRYHHSRVRTPTTR
jgi:hypothetical protein